MRFQGSDAQRCTPRPQSGLRYGQWLAKWAAAGVLGVIRDQLRRWIRQGMGGAPHTVAIVIDSPSVKAAETVAKDSRGYDAGKRIFRLRLMHPELTVVRTDSASAGQLVTRAKDATGFVVLPRRWVVERSLGWIMHARRRVRDYECLGQHSEALIIIAGIILMTRRLTRPTGPGPPARATAGGIA